MGGARCDNLRTMPERRWLLAAVALLLPLGGLALLIFQPTLDLV